VRFSCRRGIASSQEETDTGFGAKEGVEGERGPLENYPGILQTRLKLVPRTKGGIPKSKEGV